MASITSNNTYLATSFLNISEIHKLSIYIVGPMVDQPPKNEALDSIYEELRPIKDDLDAFNLYL